MMLVTAEQAVAAGECGIDGGVILEQSAADELRDERIVIDHENFHRVKC